MPQVKEPSENCGYPHRVKGERKEHGVPRTRLRRGLTGPQMIKQKSDTKELFAEGVIRTVKS